VARFAPLVPLVAGALMLVAGEFMVVREIRAVTVVPPGGSETGGGLHGYALAVIGVALLPMAYGAVVGRARPAALAVLVLALAACAIVLFVDRPALDDTGSIGTLYELAEAHPGPGFYVAAAGAALALVGAIGALVLSVRTPRRRAAGRTSAG
jgi:hypothetical protein